METEATQERQETLTEFKEETYHAAFRISIRHEQRSEFNSESSSRCAIGLAFYPGCLSRNLDVGCVALFGRGPAVAKRFGAIPKTLNDEHRDPIRDRPKAPGIPQATSWN